jgi:hypothetical protein
MRRKGGREVLNCKLVEEYIRLCVSTLLILSVRNPKLLSKIALLPLKQ